ncbi:elongin-C-like [Uloborus diversus]|uniref:elongin-C-like n=1 Tax=Uloborus diversus TaxID=327109 RepID=UPI0024094C31|nr:elongin-C-like [Uloborus diversus]
MEGTQSLGGYIGPQAEYIKLVSSDGFEFFIKEKYTITSKTIKDMLHVRHVLEEDEENFLKFEAIKPSLMMEVCKYFIYKSYYTLQHFDAIPKFPVNLDALGYLLRVADYLKC